MVIDISLNCFLLNDVHEVITCKGLLSVEVFIHYWIFQDFTCHCDPTSFNLLLWGRFRFWLRFWFWLRFHWVIDMSPSGCVFFRTVVVPTLKGFFLFEVFIHNRLFQCNPGYSDPTGRFLHFRFLWRHIWGVVVSAYRTFSFCFHVFIPFECVFFMEDFVCHRLFQDNLTIQRHPTCGHLDTSVCHHFV